MDAASHAHWIQGHGPSVSKDGTAANRQLQLNRGDSMSTLRIAEPAAADEAPRPRRAPAPPQRPDMAAPESPFASLDRSLRASLGRVNGGLSPAALGAAYLDWAVHLMASPGRQL